MKIKYHAGQLLLRWLYAIALLGVGVGLCFAAQALWEIAWYQLFALLAAVVGVSMVGQTVCCVIGSVTVDQDGWTWREGWCGRTVRKVTYANIINVREKQSAWDRRLHCTTLLVQARSGWDGLINGTLCVSEANAKRLLAGLEQEATDSQEEVAAVQNSAAADTVQPVAVHDSQDTAEGQDNAAVEVEAVAPSTDDTLSASNTLTDKDSKDTTTEE